MVEVLHLGCGLPTSNLWIDKLDEPLWNRGRCCAMRCDAQAGELPAETEAIAYRALLRDLQECRRPALTPRGGSLRHVWTPRPILARFPDGLFCLPMPVFSEGGWSNSRHNCTLCNSNPLLRLIDCILCLEPWVLLCQVGTKGQPSRTSSTLQQPGFNPLFAFQTTGIVSFAACRHPCPSCRRDRPDEPLPSASRS